jgi:hypothetical protein
MLTDEPDAPGDALANPVTAIAVRPKGCEEISKKVESSSNSCKVYQTDVEVAALFVLPDSELLLSFKLLAPLARVDRCTGRNYAHLHGRQSNILCARNRFRRIQRMHTSDGDKAQSLAERVLENRLSKDKLYSVPTFRAQCQVHRVFHVMTCGMALFNNFVSGQIRFALSLRGPGNFKKFKEFLWTWLLAHHQYIYEEHPQGPGQAADDHRRNTFDVYFPVCRGRAQRRNRLKLWVVWKLPNGGHSQAQLFPTLLQKQVLQVGQRLLV